MPPGIPPVPIQMAPSGSNSNLYMMASPTEINPVVDESTGMPIGQPTTMMPTVNPYTVPYVTGGGGAPAPPPRYSYAR